MEIDTSLFVPSPPHENLSQLFKQQGDKIRKLKADSELWQNDEGILAEVWKLLALKTNDPELGAIPPEQRGPYTLKIRWRVNKPGGTATPTATPTAVTTLPTSTPTPTTPPISTTGVVAKTAATPTPTTPPISTTGVVAKTAATQWRFQNIFKNRFYLTGDEVAIAIHNYMSKKNIIKKTSIQNQQQQQQGFTKIELIAKADKTTEKKKHFVALTTKSLVRIPLSFPGPYLASEGILEFRVSWPGPRYHFTTPEVYENQIPELIDAGVNLFSKEFPNLDLVVTRANEAGVTQMACISVDYETSLSSVQLAKKYVHSLYATVGVHPTEVKKNPPTEEAVQQFRDLLKNERNSIVAIGECGIDFEKKLDESSLSFEEIVRTQEKWLDLQLDLAEEFNLPVLVHQRGGFSECIKILDSHCRRNRNLVLIINCFNGNLEELQFYLGLCPNVYFVITGLICSEDRGLMLRDVVKAIPLDRLLLASDAPYLNPYNMPRPFPRRNEPAFLGHVLVFVATCVGCAYEKLAIQTTMNARKAYGLPTILYNGKTTKTPTLFVEIQKEEEAVLQKKTKPTKPNTLTIEPDQSVFVITKEDNTTKVAFVVTSKEKSIMEKQLSQKKTSTQLVELAETIELKIVQPFTNVLKGEEIVYSNVPKQ